MRANQLWSEWAESRKACVIPALHKPDIGLRVAKNGVIMSKRRGAVKMSITKLMKGLLPSVVVALRPASDITYHVAHMIPVVAIFSSQADSSFDDNDHKQ
jgi:hypothetical protein